jgi:hypothetical protein
VYSSCIRDDDDDGDDDDDDDDDDECVCVCVCVCTYLPTCTHMLFYSGSTQSSIRGTGTNPCSIKM